MAFLGEWGSDEHLYHISEISLGDTEILPE